MDPIALSIPFFLILIAIELVVLRVQGRMSDAFRFNDAIASISCGIAQQVTGVLIKVLLIVPYTWIWSRAPVHLTGPLAWLVAFIGVDVLFYVWHRWAHTVNVGWATHVVHHQSERLNLATALRQSLTATFTYQPFNWVLAILGVPPLVYFTSEAINRLYQFWIHTETIGRLPAPIEAVFNTPSHHRVHHGVNPRYLDRNYAGMLIVWDRLFGTFEPESEPAVYGTLSPVRTFDPLLANAQGFAAIAADARAAGGLDALRIWWKKPGWRPGALPPAPDLDDVLAARGFDPPAPAWVRLYVAAWFLPVAAMTAGALILKDSGRWGLLAALAAHGVAAGVGWAALLESKRWAPAFESARALAFIAVVSAATGSAYLTLASAAFALVSVVWLVSRRFVGASEGIV